MLMATKNYSSQHSFQASLTLAAKKTLDDMADATRIPKVQLFSQIVEFYAKLPHKLRQEILWPPEGESDRDVAMKVWEYTVREMANPAAGPKQSSLPPGTLAAIDRDVAKVLESKESGTPPSPRSGPPREPSPVGGPVTHGRKKN